MKRINLFLAVFFIFTNISAQIPGPQTEYKLINNYGTFKVNNEAGTLLSGPSVDNKPLVLFAKGGLQFHGNSIYPFPFGTPPAELTTNAEWRMLFGTLSIKYGRNNSPTIIGNIPDLLRVGSQSGIGFWGDGNVDNNDNPNVIIKNDGTMWTQNLMPLNGQLQIKAGLNEDPTIKSEKVGWLRIGGKAGIAFWGDGNADVNNNPHLMINSNNSVTIGSVSTSNYKLNIGGSIYTENNGVKTYIGKDSDKDDVWIGTQSSHGLYLGTNHASGFYMDAQYHNTYIGLIDTDIARIRTELKNKYKLFVAKGILSEDYSIAPKSSWADFVFSKEYKLKNITELEAYISKNKHLPDVPSARQIAKEGYSQHDMNTILLRKIEELTLYTIQQQKEIESLKTQLNIFTK